MKEAIENEYTINSLIFKEGLENSLPFLVTGSRLVFVWGQGRRREEKARVKDRKGT